MLLAPVFAVILLAAAPNAASAASAVAAEATSQSVSPDKGASDGAPADSPSRPSIGSGSRAPDFQYQSYDNLWQNLHNVLEHGDVLLIFGASDVDLRTLEREREALVKGSVLPLAVIEKPDREVWALVRRLGLTFSLMADPRGAIGTQYGVFDPGVGRSSTSWFFIDRKGRVKSAGIGAPQGWLALASNAFGRAIGGQTQPSSKR